MNADLVAIGRQVPGFVGLYSRRLNATTSLPGRVARDIKEPRRVCFSGVGWQSHISHLVDQPEDRKSGLDSHQCNCSLGKPCGHRRGANQAAPVSHDQEHTVTANLHLPCHCSFLDADDEHPISNADDPICSFANGGPKMLDRSPKVIHYRSPNFNDDVKLVGIAISKEQTRNDAFLFSHCQICAC